MLPTQTGPLLPAVGADGMALTVKLAALEVVPFVSNGNSNLVPLGDYTVTFGDAPARSIAARFVDNGGPLEVAGTLVVSPAREYTFDALIKPRAGAPQPSR